MKGKFNVSFNELDFLIRNTQLYILALESLVHKMSVISTALDLNDTEKMGGEICKPLLIMAPVRYTICG